MHARPTSSKEVPQRQSGLTIMFTEISFSLETSILLQIIRKIHMTIWIISESDKKGRAVRQIWLQGGIHNETPTEKNFPSWGTFGPPPPPF